jgi:hypothetical protein
MNNKLLILGGLIPILVLLVIPHVFAESDSKRARDGFTDGSNAARDDVQNGNSFNPVCDPNGIHTSDGQHTTIYCNAWNEGYTSTWNQLYQPPSQQQPAQNVGPGGSGQQSSPNIILQCKNVVNCNPNTAQKTDQNGEVTTK